MDGFNTTLNQDGNGGGGGAAAQLAVSITYAALVALREAGNLVPGTWYRITDYVCTTTQDNTQSAEHAFDVIVRADDASHLNENAFAARHEGDEYFANCKLEAWELKYCLDNDTNRFAWADEENGTGVIFYMKDEWNNECPYDFKNIMFKRLLVSGKYAEEKYQDEGVELLYLGIPENTPSVFTVDENDFIWVYTFNGIDDSEDYTQSRDVTVKGFLSGDDPEEGGYPANLLACDVVMEPYRVTIVEDGGAVLSKAYLNNIVFLQTYWLTSKYDVHGTNFVSGCHDMTIMSTDNYGIHFGANCFANVIGNCCYGNSFGNDCNSNSFGNNCQNNSFGNGCFGNTFGNGCNGNTFGNYCIYNSFGNSCDSNSFGNDCYENTFGNNCYYNSFGNDCASNSFGNGCNENTFGNNFQRNTFGNYCQTITVFDGVQYCSVTGGSSSAPVKNAQILNGTAGASAQNKLTIGFAANKAYTQVAAKTTAGTLKVFNPADLVQ